VKKGVSLLQKTFWPYGFMEGQLFFFFFFAWTFFFIFILMHIYISFLRAWCQSHGEIKFLYFSRPWFHERLFGFSTFQEFLFLPPFLPWIKKKKIVRYVSYRDTIMHVRIFVVIIRLQLLDKKKCCTNYLIYQ